MNAVHAYVAALMLALICGSTAAQTATGSITEGQGDCAATSGVCQDVVAVNMSVGEEAVARKGAIFVALLPLSPSGMPISNQGGYATFSSGWTVSPMPTPYAVGSLPATWNRNIPVDGGICQTAKSHGIAGRITLGLFAGYGLVGDSPAANPAMLAARATTIARAEATNDPQVIANVQHMFSGGESAKVQGGRSAANMLQAKTFWKLSEITCHE